MKATDNNPVLIASEQVKSSIFPDTLLFRMAAVQNQLRLVLNNEAESSRDEVVLAFDDRASEDFDAQFDANKPKLPMMISNLAFRNENGDFLGVHTIEKPDLSIKDKHIPLSLDAKAGTYNLQAHQISSFSNDVEFYLENKLNGSIQLLEEGKSYSIEITEGNEEAQSNAYSLRIRNQTSVTVANPAAIRAFPNPTNGETVTVWVNDNSRGTLEVFDALGNRVGGGIFEPKDNSIKLDSFRNNAAGIYTITWTTKTTRSSTRITVN